jgi:hypothetical protein
MARLKGGFSHGREPEPPGGGRDLPDRPHGAVASYVSASARLATPAERAPVRADDVGGSVHAASRPAVTPD